MKILLREPAAFKSCGGNITAPMSAPCSLPCLPTPSPGCPLPCCLPACIVCCYNGAPVAHSNNNKNNEHSGTKSARHLHNARPFVPRRRLLVCLVAPFDDSNFNEIILCVRAVLVCVCVSVCAPCTLLPLILPVSLTEQCCIKISLKLFANGLNMLRFPPSYPLPSSSLSPLPTFRCCGICIYEIDK